MVDELVAIRSHISDIGIMLSCLSSIDDVIGKDMMVNGEGRMFHSQNQNARRSHTQDSVDKSERGIVVPDRCSWRVGDLKGNREGIGLDGVQSNRQVFRVVAVGNYKVE